MNAADKNLGVSISTLTLKHGSTIQLPAKGVTAIVGGNNVGKSSVLRESASLLGRHIPSDVSICKVVENARMSKTSSADELIDWLTRSGYKNETGRFALPGQSPGEEEERLRNIWNSSNAFEAAGVLSRYLVHVSEPSARVGIVGGVQRRENIGHLPTHPLHYLEDDPELVAEFDNVCERIFKIRLTLDRLSGIVMLRVGTTSGSAPPIDAVSREYLRELTQLPLLSEQGDGMRSLLGLLLIVMTSTYPIVLIDEPEAFLHPPQAFELGRVLGEIAKRRDIQIILATHDRNLIAGLLEADEQLTLVRLDRSGNRTTASQLDSNDVKLLWSDSVLRYSNVIEGLFHRLVILCEADDDCRFYRAALDSLSDEMDLPLPSSEIFFAPTGGKDGMAKIARALVALRVRVVASPDLDMLDDRGKLKRLVEAFGHDVAAFEQDYRKAVVPFQIIHPQAKCRDVLNAVQGVLQGSLDEAWDDSKREEVRAQMRLSESPWKKLKVYGIAAFTSGDSWSAANRLIDALDAIGICMVKVGELERFAKGVSVRKGPSWLPAAIETEAHRSEDAKDHVRRLLSATSSVSS